MAVAQGHCDVQQQLSNVAPKSLSPGMRRCGSARVAGPRRMQRRARNERSGSAPMCTRACGHTFAEQLDSDWASSAGQKRAIWKRSHVYSGLQSTGRQVISVNSKAVHSALLAGCLVAAHSGPRCTQRPPCASGSQLTAVHIEWRIQLWTASDVTCQHSQGRILT